jgi:hypothetical protein
MLNREKDSLEMFIDAIGIYFFGYPISTKLKIATWITVISLIIAIILFLRP